MPFYTMEEVAQIAVNNGFPATDQNNLITCVAICWGESGGNSDNVNAANSDGSIDTGLWQINSIHNGTLPGQDRKDPNVNAKLMMIISSNGSNWSPWVAYTNGSYQKFIPEATSAIAGKTFTPGTPVKGSGTGSVSPAGVTDYIPGAQALQGVENFFSALTEPDTWFRLGLILLGGLCWLVALSLYLGKSVVSTAASFTPVGRVGKALT